MNWRWNSAYKRQQRTDAQMFCKVETLSNSRAPYDASTVLLLLLTLNLRR